MKVYSTKQVAQMVSVHRITLVRWQKAGHVRASHSVGFNGSKVWLWTVADVRAVRRYKKLRYWQGGGRKPKAK